MVRNILIGSGGMIFGAVLLGLLGSVLLGYWGQGELIGEMQTGAISQEEFANTFFRKGRERDIYLGGSDFPTGRTPCWIAYWVSRP